jgi:serine phosphatase RsbU (regulator of sigma subunit)
MVDSMADSQGGAPAHLRTVPTPVDLAPLEGLDLCARYYAERSGGDFFDAVVVGSRLIFILTDIAGPKSEAHGIASSMQTVFRHTASTLFTDAGANESEAIASLAHEVNRALIDTAGGVRLAPAFLACFNLGLGIMTYCNAGQMPAVFRDAESTHVLEQGGVPLGLFTHVTYEPALLAFQPGDKLLLATKGVIQTRRGATEFGVEHMEEIIANANSDTAAQICDTVLQQAHEFGEHPLAQLIKLLPGKRHEQDDLTAVALVRKTLA